MTATDTKQAPTGTEVALGEPKDKEAHGLMARLGKWLDRDRWPVPAETQTLFTARMTDVAANRLAKQWSVRYLAGDGKERRALLAALAEASAALEPRGEQGLRLFRRLYAQADSLHLLVELRCRYAALAQPGCWADGA